MGNSYFHFKQFSINQEGAAMKVGVDSVLLGAWINVETAKTVLDVGTGTGLLALMLAQKNQELQVDAIDIDATACAVAIENVNASRYAHQIKVYHQPLQEFAHNHLRMYDLVISNPPYFDEAIKPKNESRRAARHNNGLPLSAFLENAQKVLKEKGVLVFIYPVKMKNMPDEMLDKNGLFIHKKVWVRPMEGKEANRVIYKMGKAKVENVEESIIYMRENGDYSAQFKAITKDYYLKG